MEKSLTNALPDESLKYIVLGALTTITAMQRLQKNSVTPWLPFEYHFSQMIVRRGKGGTFYREYTLTTDAKELYAMAYGYDETEFLSSAG